MSTFGWVEAPFSSRQKVIKGLLLASVSLIAVPGAAWAQGAATQSLSTIDVEAAGAREDARGAVDGLVAKRTASGSKTSSSIAEIPQSISVVGRPEMEQLGATTVSEALHYTPGIVTTARPSQRYDIGSIRGFGGQSWFDYVDGMRIARGGFNAPIMDAWNVERIEVLKGPASVLYGSVMPGGLVNQITKKPRDVAGGEVFARGGSPGRMETGFDFYGPLTSDKTLLYRVVGLGRIQESNVDDTRSERVMIAPSITWRPTASTDITVQAGYINDPKSFYAVYLPAVGTLLKHPSGRQIPYNFNVEDPNFSRFSREQSWVGYQLRHSFSNNLELRHQLRYMEIDSTQRGVTPSAWVMSGGIPTTTMQRTAAQTIDSSRALTTDTQLEARLATGPIAHTVLGGVDYQYLDFKRGAVQGIAAPSIDFSNPVYSYTANLTNTQRVTESRSQIGFYLQDQMKFDRFVLTLGGRQDMYRSDLDTTMISTGVTTPTNADQSKFTWRAGLAYLFDNGISPYASYATSFEPVSGAGPGFNASGGTGVGGSPFKPTTGEQYEIGLRYQPTSFNGLFTLAYFDITQQNVLVSTGIADPTCSNPFNCQTQAGEVRSKGFEFEAKLEPIKGLNFIASYAYVDAKTTKSGGFAGATPVGAAPTAVPEHQAALWSHYSFAEASTFRGLGLGAGFRYMGETYADPANLYSVPSFTLMDAAISYDFGVRDRRMKGVKMSVNAYNLLGKEYVASCSAVTPFGFCYYGEGRTVTATLSYKW